MTIGHPGTNAEQMTVPGIHEIKLETQTQEIFHIGCDGREIVEI